MIYIDNRCFWMIIPKVDRCNLDPCNVYQLILTNVFTKDIYVFKVKDVALTDRRFNIWVELPECAEYGEYEYYLISNDEWNPIDIDSNIPKDSIKCTDKSAITFNGKYLVAGDYLLVTKFFYTQVSLGDKIVTDNEGNRVLVEQVSEDTNSIDDLYKTLDIIARGMLTYKDECNNDKYIKIKEKIWVS